MTSRMPAAAISRCRLLNECRWRLRTGATGEPPELQMDQAMAVRDGDWLPGHGWEHESDGVADIESSFCVNVCGHGHSVDHRSS